MSPRGFAAVLAASALITFDGTAATVAIPAMARGLSLSYSQVQWVSNAPLLMLTTLLLPAGALADLYGRTQLMRIGLAIFGVASIACAAAPQGGVLIAGRLLQGAGGALILPVAVAQVRSAYSDSQERARRFGVWAAWTGVAGVLGPLLGGTLADVVSWRAVFVTSACVSGLALVLLEHAPHTRAERGGSIPLIESLALGLFLAALAYLLIDGRNLGWRSVRVVAAGALIPLSLVTFVRSSQRHALFPPELLAARNCIPANAATFAVYFGVFGVSFLLVLYTQQALGYSGMWAGSGVLPISLMLFLAEPFGRMAPRAGTHRVVALGSVVAAAGILWLATGSHPLAFWSRIILGTSIFGLGVSVAASSLTHAAVSAVPEKCAGVASGFNHATVRAAGLLAIALLGSIAADGERMGPEGFRRALVLCGIVVAVLGVTAGLVIRNDAPGGLENAA
jgi:MFS family permease